MKPLVQRIILLTFVCSLLPKLHAHGDLHERIVAKTTEIETYPDSAFLYIYRGELHFQHESYEESIADYETAYALGYDDHRLDIDFAKTYDRLEEYELALTYLSKVLDDIPNHVIALRTQGKVLYNKGDYEKAAQSFEGVIAHAADLFTENYMEASRAWEACGSAFCMQKSVEALLNGKADLGNLFVFNHRLVSLYKSMEDYEQAIAYQDIIIESANRKERPLFERALINMEAGNLKAAKADLELARAAIYKLPIRLQHIMATKNLKTEIDELATELP